MLRLCNRFSPTIYGFYQARTYVSRQHIERHLNSLEQLANTLEPAKKEHGFQRSSKIVATIGPKVANEADITKLMKAGVNVMRFNFSHGEYHWFEKSFALIRKVKDALGREDVAIALDTKGPEIRTGRLAQGSAVGNPGYCLPIAAGDKLTFAAKEELAEKGDQSGIYIDYADVGNVLNPGDTMMVDDGLLEFKVIQSGDGFVQAEAVNAGLLGERKGVNLPGKELTLPAVSVKDKSDLEFGVQQNVDLIFASFIRKGSQVEEVRNVLGPAGKHIKIISKIENLEGVQNFDEILEASDGIMVARGDLGIEIPAPKVFVAQKLLVMKCNIAGKPVICATQMLDSMITNPRPTRAEVTDVAGAIMDGADAVMLSGETAKGAWPEEAVRAMSAVVREAEAAIDQEGLKSRMQMIVPRPAASMEAVCAGAARLAEHQVAACILVVTETGEAPAKVAKYRPSVPIIAACSDGQVARQCALLRGVVPVVIPWKTRGSVRNVHIVIYKALAKATEIGLANAGQAVVLHDADITDDDEMSNWVLRIVEFE